MSSGRLLAGLCASLAALVLVASLLSWAPSGGAHDRAAAAAAHSPAVRHVLAGRRPTAVRVTDRDAHLRAVTYLRGTRILAYALVNEAGRVTWAYSYERGDLSFGSSLLRKPALLLGALFVFLLAVGSVRRRSWLLWADLTALAGYVAVMMLLDRLVLAPAMCLGYLAHAYLGARCLGVALGRGAPLPAATSGALRRVLPFAAAACALAATLVVVTSDGVVDIGYASMRGATLLLHGTLPYGHIAGVFHGDTYPLLDYVAYLPAALLAPVHDVWDSTDGALWIGAATLLLAAALTARALAVGTDGRARLAIAMLSFPPVLGVAASGANDLLVAAMLLWALLVFARPALSASVLAAGAWCKIAPVIVLPAWLARFRGRQLAAALAGVGGVSAAVLAATVALGGSGGISATASALAFQLERSSPHSVWVLSGLHALRPVAELLAAAIVVAAVALVRRDPRLAASPPRMCGLMGTAMIAVQVSSDYWSYSYLPWVLPLVMVSLFAADALPEDALDPSGWRRMRPRPAAMARSSRSG